MWKAHLSRFLTTDSGLSSSFLAGLVSALFLETVCETPASIGDRDIGEAKAVGGNGFLRIGEETCGDIGEAKEFEMVGGVGF